MKKKNKTLTKEEKAKDKEAAHKILNIYVRNRRRPPDTRLNPRKLLAKVRRRTAHLVNKDRAKRLLQLDRKPRALVPTSSKKPVATKTLGKSFSDATEDMRVIRNHTDPDDEASQYYDFVSRILQLKPKVMEVNEYIYYESAYGIWFPHFLRYKNRTEKAKSLQQTNHPFYWQTVNLADSTVIAQIRVLLAATEASRKPIVFLASSHVHRAQKQVGHTIAVIIFRYNDKRFAIVKDCLTIDEVKVSDMVKKVLVQTKVQAYLPVAELATEETIVESECLRECYRVVSRILDGNFYKTREMFYRNRGWQDPISNLKFVGETPFPASTDNLLNMEAKLVLQKIKI